MDFFFLPVVLAGVVTIDPPAPDAEPMLDPARREIAACQFECNCACRSKGLQSKLNGGKRSADIDTEPIEGADPESMTKSERKNLFAGAIGNTIEFYDFIIYAYLAVFVAEHFFPAGDSATAMLASYGAFASGMLMRPLGGILFGTIGDRLGRKAALQLSVLLIAVPTLIIGLMPTYTSIGIAAPIILVILRMLQGLSVGGEYASAVVFLIETSPARRRGVAGSFGPLGAVGGLLLGTLMTYLTTLALGEERMHDGDGACRSSPASC